MFILDSVIEVSKKQISVDFRSAVFLAIKVCFFLFLNLCPFKAKAYSNSEPDKAIGLEFGNGQILFHIPHIEHSQEEFEQMDDLDEKTLELGKHMLKLKNMLGDQNLETPIYQHNVQELFEADIENIILDPVLNSELYEQTSNTSSGIIKSIVREKILLLNQRLVLEKALNQLFVWCMLSSSRTFLSQDILNKIEQKFSGLARLAKGMSVAIEEEISSLEKDRLLDTTVNSLIWYGIEVGSVYEERTHFQEHLEDIRKQIYEAREEERDSLREQELLLSEQIATHTALINQLLSYKPWLTLLQETVEDINGNRIVYIDLLWRISKAQFEQGNFNYDEGEFVSLKRLTRSFIEQKTLQAVSGTTNFIIDILTDDPKYVAPLVVLRTETLEVIHQTIQRLESQEQYEEAFPDFQSYREADYYMLGLPYGFTGNKFHALTWNEVLNDLFIAVGSGVLMRFLSTKGTVQTVDIADGIRRSLNHIGSKPTSTSRTWARNWTKDWWGKSNQTAYGKMYRLTPIVLVGQAAFYAHRYRKKKSYREELMTHIPNARWAGAVSLDYAFMAANLGTKDLSMNAWFDVLGTFTMTRWFRHLQPIRILKGTTSFASNTINMPRKIFIGTKNNATQFTNMMKEIWSAKIKRNPVLVRRLYKKYAFKGRILVDNAWRNYISKYLREITFVAGSMGFLIGYELDRLGRPGLFTTMRNAWNREDSFPDKIRTMFEDLWFASKMAMIGDRQAFLDIFSIAAIDGTFIFFANKGAMPTHNLAMLYAGGTFGAEMVGQAMLGDQEPFSNEDHEANLYSRRLDQFGWERLLVHIGYVSTFSIVKYLAAYNTGIRVISTTLAAKDSYIKPLASVKSIVKGKGLVRHSNLEKFRDWVLNKRFPHRKTKYNYLFETGHRVGKGNVVSAGWEAATIQEVITRRFRWLGFEFFASFANNALGNGIFVWLAGKLENNRIGSKSLQPEIIQWTKDRMQEQGLDNDHETLNSLYQDVTEHISILHLIKADVMDQTESNNE